MVDVESHLSRTAVPNDRAYETIDARELPPPRPLKDTLERLESSNGSVVLVQINDRAPQHLYPRLDQRGFDYETVDTEDGVVTAIWRK